MSSSNSNMRITIVGAGIAGIATAIAMRAENREIIILEASRMKSEVGAAIHLAPNATKILYKYGFDVAKEAKSTVCRQVYEIGSDNAIHFKIPMDTEKAFGAPWLFQHRVDLHNALRDYALREDLPGPPTKFITGAKVVDVDCDAGKVTTADGQTYEADLIVGADGIHSKVREAILGEMKVAQPSGHSAYRCLIPKEDVEDIPECQEVLVYDNSPLKIVVGGNRRVILYPCRNATILNIVAVCPDTAMKEQSTQSWNQEGNVEDLLAAFTGFPEWLLKTLSRAKSPGLWQLRDQDPLPTWVRGRAIIIGDAAHSMLPHQGQGAGQSIEDAEALGAFFEGVQGSPSTEQVNKLLQDIFQGRFKRASTIQQYSRDQALPAGEGAERVTLNPNQFAGYNMSYSGIKDWIRREVSASA